MNCPTCHTSVPSVAKDPWCHTCGGYFSELADPPDALTQSVLAPDTEPRRIVIPWDQLVSVNTRSGGMVGWTSQEYREGLSAMRKTVTAQAMVNRWSMLSGPVALQVDYYPPDRRRRDLHNYDKATIDSLIASVIEDDSQVVEWSGRKLEVSSDPRAVVTVTAIEVEQAA